MDRVGLGKGMEGLGEGGGGGVLGREEGGFSVGKGRRER